MTVEQFKHFHYRRPFSPFVIHMADGRSFGVAHPETVIPSKSGRTVSVVNTDGEMEALDLLLVTSLRPMSAAEIRAKMVFKR